MPCINTLMNTAWPGRRQDGCCTVSSSTTSRIQQQSPWAARIASHWSRHFLSPPSRWQSLSTYLPGDSPQWSNRWWPEGCYQTKKNERSQRHRRWQAHPVQGTHASRRLHSAQLLAYFLLVAQTVHSSYQAGAGGYEEPETRWEWRWSWGAATREEVS